MSKEQRVFVLADQTLQKVVGKIRDDQWDIEVPAYMVYAEQKAVLRDLVNRHVYDDLWVSDTLAGMTIEEVGSKYDGDLLGSDPLDSFASAVDAATSAVLALDADELDRTVHLSYGDFPVRVYLEHITIFRGFRAYTIANLIGADTTLDPALVQGLWDIVMPDLESLRQMGVFGPAKEVPEDADQQTKLLGLTGFLQQ